MKRITKFIALAVALLVFLAGCQMTDTSWVFELEDERIPAGTYMLFLNEHLTRGTNMLIEEWIEWMEQADENSEEPPNIFEMSADEILNVQLEGMRMQDWALAETQNFIRQFFAVRTLLVEHDIEPDIFESAIALMSANAEYRENEQRFREMGVAESSLALAYLSSVNMSALFNGLYGEGGPYEIPQAELSAHFDENFVAGQELIFFKYIPPLTGEESEEERAEIVQEFQEANDGMRAVAQDFLERLESGEYTFEQLQFERELLFSPNPEDVMQQRPGILDFVTSIDNPTHHNQIVVDGLTELSVGEAGIFEDELIITVVRRLDVFSVEGAMDEHMNAAIWALRFEDVFMPMLEELGATLPVVVNSAAVSRYNPSFLMNIIWE
ncbi:MAG: hypothetical protein FWE19_01790 [Oscillospiraceae bacterium]|nr:hypothetical protein [Oscillospiraceae bacterium]